MTPKLLVFLVVGTGLMALPILSAARKYELQIWKTCLITFLLTVFGTIGTFIMFYLENKAWGGLSFYGAVFLVPIVFLPISKILCIPYGKIMDLCAVGECIMLALMKIHCMLGGCCLGRVLFLTESGIKIRFPSRSVELLVAFVIFAILLRWTKKGEKTQKLYPMYLLMYGSSRFVLNVFREAWVVKEMFLPFGNIWSLLAIAIGVVWLHSLKKTKRQERSSHE